MAFADSMCPRRVILFLAFPLKPRFPRYLDFVAHRWRTRCLIELLGFPITRKAGRVVRNIWVVPYITAGKIAIDIRSYPAADRVLSQTRNTTPVQVIAKGARRSI